MRRLTATLVGLLVWCAGLPVARADVPSSLPALAAVAPATSAPEPATQAPAPEPAAATPAPSERAPTSRAARAERPRRRRGERAAAPPRAASLSLGHPNSGRLENGARLVEDETIRFMPGWPLHYGTDELVGLIRRAARAVHRRHRARLSVGDLSRAAGGPARHHASHQSGRDADLGFYVVNRRGESVALGDYIGFRGDGAAMASASLRFDTARNWALVEALLEDPVVRVEHIFVSHGLRALLLAHARASGASSGTIARAEAAMHQPTHGSPHANHFHVRIACPAGDRACIDYVWRPPPRRRRRVAQAGGEHRRAPGRATGAPANARPRRGRD